MTEEDLKYWYEERAGICQFCGLQTRPEAEALAKAEMESHVKALERAELIETAGQA